ncbi:MAG: PEGA domain-containing protein [Proteobacteria bacterium]|nr:PEGA domain-containing protein [Pseudomonadota bacterium]
MSKLTPFSQILLLTVLLAACGATRPEKADPRGTLRFNGQPRDASVEIDDVHLGPIHMFEKKGLLLRPGMHRITVRANGYFPVYRRVEIVEGKLIVLEITLRPIPD